MTSAQQNLVEASCFVRTWGFMLPYGYRLRYDNLIVLRCETQLLMRPRYPGVDERTLKASRHFLGLPGEGCSKSERVWRAVRLGARGAKL